MSEKLKVGDRVRLTYVGTVKGVHKDGGVAVADGSNRVFTWSDEAVESVEKLARTFRPGTLVQVAGGMAVRTNTRDRWTWVDTGGFSGVLTDQEVSDILANKHRRGELLHEPTI